MLPVLFKNGIELVVCDFAFLDEKPADSIISEIVHIHDGFNAFPLGAEDGVLKGEMRFFQKSQITADENEVGAENKITACKYNDPNDKFFQTLLHVFESSE
jgi:hypothetical protein